MKKFREKIADVLINRKWLVLTILIVLTLGLSIFIKNLKIDNSLECWFLKNDPTLINYNEFKKIYGNDEIISVWIKPAGNEFNREFVTQIYDVSQALEKNPMVKRVVSISKAPYMDMQNNELIVEDLVKERPDEHFQFETLKNKIESTPLWNKILFNKDKTATMMLIEPVASPDMDLQRPQILSFVKNSLIGFDYKLAGMGVMYDELNKISLNDSSLFTTLSFILLLVTLCFLFRRAYVLKASIIVSVINTLLFLGIFTLFGQNLNMVTAILPSLLIILGLEDVIFILSNYEAFPEGKNRLRDSLAFTMAPCFFTSLTTALGFFAFSTSPMAILKNFGIFAAIGVMLEFVVALIVCAFVIKRKEEKQIQSQVPATAQKQNSMDAMFERFMSWVSAFDQKHYKVIVIAFVVLFAIGVYGTTHLTIDTYSIDFLLDKNTVKQDSRFIEADYGFYLPMEIRLKTNHADGIKDPEFLKKLDRLEQNLETIPQFQKVTSIVDVVKQLNKVLTDNNDSSYKIPDTRNAVAQELLLYELGEDNDLSYFVDGDYSEARLTVRIPMVSSRSMKKCLDAADAEIKKIFTSNDVTVVYGGYIPLYIKLIDYTAESQISSFLLAFILIFISAGFLFRSIPQFLIIILPNIFPIIMTLAFMAVTHIFLDIATVTIAAVTIGLSVDNSIHFLNMYNKLRSEGLSLKDGIEKSLLSVGKPMFVSNIILIAGYLIMLFANIKSVIFFGALIALTLFIAVLADILLLPSMMLLFFRKENK